MPKHIQAIFFDLGHTLIYSTAPWPAVIARGQQAMLGQLTADGFELPGTQFLAEYDARINAYYRERESEFIEYTVSYVLRNLLAEMGYPNVSEADVRPALNALYAVTQQNWYAEEDALPTLQALLNRGYRLGLISNAADDQDVQELVDQAGLRACFEFILTSAAVGIRKPNPRIFEIALQALDVPASRAVMVGDTLGADILGAQHVGMLDIWVTRRAETPGNRAHLETIHPTHKVKTLAEIPDLISKIDNLPPPESQ